MAVDDVLLQRGDGLIPVDVDRIGAHRLEYVHEQRASHDADLHIFEVVGGLYGTDVVRKLARSLFTPADHLDAHLAEALFELRAGLSVLYRVERLVFIRLGGDEPGQEEEVARGELRSPVHEGRDREVADAVLHQHELVRSLSREELSVPVYFDVHLSVGAFLHLFGEICHGLAGRRYLRDVRAHLIFRLELPRRERGGDCEQ